MKSPFSKALLIGLPVFVLLLLLVRSNPRGNFWGTVEPPKAQCEAYNSVNMQTLNALSSAIYDQTKINRLVREPQNSLSNLPYIIVGLAIFLASRRRISKGLALGCIFLGFGSGMYHASLLPEWRLIDILGVYVVLFGLIALGIDAIYAATRKDFTEFIVNCLVWIASFLTGVHRNDVRIVGFKIFDSTYVVVAGVTVVSLLAFFAYKRTKNHRHYFTALITLALAAPIAFAGGLGDRFGGFLASPEAMIQGHSIWHSLGAVALLSSYEVFASTGYDRSVFSPAGLT